MNERNLVLHLSYIRLGSCPDYPDCPYYPDKGTTLTALTALMWALP